MYDTPADQFKQVTEHMNRPFPKRVCPASNYAIPIFNTGMGHWNIVDREGTGDVVASIMFRMPTDPSSEMAKAYIAMVAMRVDNLANIINEGLAQI